MNAFFWITAISNRVRDLVLGIGNVENDWFIVNIRHGGD